MPSLGIALRPGGCPGHGTKPGQGAAPAPGVVSGGCDLPSPGDWDSGNPAFALSRGSRDAPPLTPGHGRRFNGMLLSPSPFRSRSAIGPKDLPPSPSRLSRGYSQAPHGALPPVGDLDRGRRAGAG